MMVIYDPGAKPPYNRPWARSYFVGCFGDRIDQPSKSYWVVPGTWPAWVTGDAVGAPLNQEK